MKLAEVTGKNNSSHKIPLYTYNRNANNKILNNIKTTADKYGKFL